MQGFDYTNAAINALETAFSAERLERYKMLSGGDVRQALQLYAWNTDLSGALFENIQSLEVALRNAVHMACTDKFGGEWFDVLAKEWALPQEYQLQQAKRQALKNKKTPAKSGDIIAELNFGFWVALFAGRYDVPLWHTALHKAFRKQAKRKDIYKMLSKARHLRNRIAHHEPILTHDLLADYQAIITTLNLIAPHVAAWAEHHSRFTNVWNNRP